MRFLVSLVALLLVSNLYGQERKFQLGILGSSQISYINSNQTDVETGGALLFGFGGIAEYHFADRYSFSSGFEFINRGGSLKVQDTTGDYRAQYIQIPLQIKMRTRQFGYNTYFAEMGFAIGFETGEKVEWEPSAPDQAGESLVSLFDANFRIGIGVEYDLGGDTRLLGRVQYHRALSNNLLASEDARLDEQYQYRFDYISLSIGVIF